MTKLVPVLWALGDPRRKRMVAQAIAVLEGHAPGPELGAAYAELAGVQFVNCEFPEAIATGERALRLAAELYLPEPARALGFAAAARCYLGDREGLAELRRALALSVAQGRSRAAAVDYGNLAVALGHYEGPQAGLAATREGVEFCERRGIGEVALVIDSARLLYLADLGATSEALTEAESLAEHAEVTGNIPALATARSVQLRLLVQRGEGAKTSAAAERLATHTRTSGAPDEVALGFVAAAEAFLAAGQSHPATVLLRELAEAPGVSRNPFYIWLVSELVRCARTLEEPELAATLAGDVEPHTPLAQHARTACLAQLAEEAGEQAEAAATYAEAAERWGQFGNVPERSYALLGEGRCLVTLGKAAAEAPLREARELFASMGYRPALTETESLLVRAAIAG
jgi:hypothetical protein